MAPKKKTVVRVRIAVVRIRSEIGTHPDIKKTFKLLQLYNKNYCAVLSNDKPTLNMVKKIKDFATFGEIDVGTFSELLSTRGRLAGKVHLTDAYLREKLKTDIKGFAERFISFENELKDIPGIKRFFRLAPPRKGFERGGIKKGFAQGGALGYRREKINDLIRRML